MANVWQTCGKLFESLGARYTACTVGMHCNCDVMELCSISEVGHMEEIDCLEKASQPTVPCGPLRMCCTLYACEAMRKSAWNEPQVMGTGMVLNVIR